MEIIMLEEFEEVSVLGTCGVYILVNEGTVVYVGKSKNLWSRIGSHMKGESKMKFDRLLFKFCPEADLEALESRLYWSYLPKHNKIQPYNGPSLAPPSPLGGYCGPNPAPRRAAPEPRIRPVTRKL